MRRLSAPLLIVGCVLGLTLACFGPVLFRGRQFGFRDAAHFYYPLYQKVHAEWQAGRWPLWEPEENAGVPLLGNPTAAVLYPGQVIYRVLPYPWAARLYIVLHVLIAFGGMWALLRSWDVSPTGAALGGLSYAFGAPVLFQYCNVIYLVGAAWLPIGFRGAERWLRRGRRWGLVELTLALALETLGGDPESAYLTGLCAGGYALGLASPRGRRADAPRRSRGRGGWWVLAGLVLAIVWVAATLALAHWLPRFRPDPERPPPRALPWMPYVPAVVALVWIGAGVVVLARWRRADWRLPLATMLVGLAGSGVLAGALTAAQLLPVVEFTRSTSRAASEGTHEIYSFSLDPVRLVEFVWPNPFGTPFEGNRHWLNAVPPQARHGKPWVPSLYVGGLPLALALAGLGLRGGPPWRAWLSIIAVVSLLGALGETTSPLWWARFLPQGRVLVGPHDPPDTTALRQDLNLRDGDGGVYWLMATVIPGFRQFRFPSKLLSFTMLALAGLAAWEFDRLARGGSARRAVIVAGGILALSETAFAVWLLPRTRWLAWLQAESDRLMSLFGPLDVPGAWISALGALLQAMAVQAAAVVVVLRARRSPGWAGAAALVALTLDLAVANAPLVLTVPQALMETRPRLLDLIEEAERNQPADGPYRVHRVPIWDPPGWFRSGSPSRVQDFVRWERATLQPKYGLPYGIEYTRTLGVAELYDYEWFFGPFLLPARGEPARLLGVTPGHEIVVYPRRGFDLWNTRYFILPFFTGGWNDEHRGIASFLPETERVYPPRGAFDGPDGERRQRAWIEQEDFQLLRNRAAFPRAWVVHSARWLKPVAGLDRSSRDSPMYEILYQDDPFWSDPTRQAYDARVLAWLEDDHRRDLARFLPGPPPGPPETVRVTTAGPQKVVLDVDLKRPGVVVLADIYYPGWALTIDGRAAPVYRANRMMRGAAVEAGRHRLVYAYRPESFRIGKLISLTGLIVGGALMLRIARRPVAASLARITDGLTPESCVQAITPASQT